MADRGGALDGARGRWEPRADVHARSAPARRPGAVTAAAAGELGGAAAATPSLAALVVGASARIGRVGGDEPLRRRLLEMGLVPGTVVTVLRRAPLGDPIEVLAHGYLLSLRLREARHVEMER